MYMTMFVVLMLWLSSPTTFFLTPKLKKHVRTHVVEKERQKEIFVLIKPAKKKQNKFAKTREKYIKRSVKLNKNRNTTREQYNAIMPEYFEARKELHEFSISNEMAMRKITTEDEWNNIMNAISAERSKSKEKDKIISANNKEFNQIINACKKNIADEERKNKAIQAIESYRNQVEKTLPYFVEVSEKDWETLRNYNATLEDYEAIDSEVLKLRDELWTVFLDTRFQLLENTTEKEWKRIIRKFNKLIKSDVID